MIDKFIDYLTFEKHYSKHTVVAYKNDLSQLQEFLAHDFETCLMSTDSKQIRSWIVALKSEGTASKSIHRKMSSAKAYFRFMQKIGELKVNPCSKIVLPKVEKRLPEYVKVQDVVSLIDAFRDDDASTFAGLRNQLIFETLYATGIRRAELIHLKESDVDLNQRTLKVLGKRNKERIVPIPDSLIGKMIAYKEKKRGLNQEGAKEFLFVTDRGEKLYEKFVYRVINKYLASVGKLKKKSPHVLRHTYATQLLERGADLASIKDLLGHESLASTQVYTHNTIEKVKKIYKSAHPKERKT